MHCLLLIRRALLRKFLNTVKEVRLSPQDYALCHDSRGRVKVEHYFFVLYNSIRIGSIPEHPSSFFFTSQSTYHQDQNRQRFSDSAARYFGRPVSPLSCPLAPADTASYSLQLRFEIALQAMIQPLVCMRRRRLNHLLDSLILLHS